MGLSFGLKPKGTKRPRPPRGLFADLAAHTRRGGPVLANSYRFASGSDAVQGRLSRSVSGLLRWTWPIAVRQLLSVDLQKQTFTEIKDLSLGCCLATHHPGHVGQAAGGQLAC